MGYFISKEIGYYEGDRINTFDDEVDQRPDANHIRDGERWIPKAWDPSSVLSEVLPLREIVLNRLTGMRFDAEDAGDVDLCTAIKAARQKIKDITKCSGALAATCDDELRSALSAEYKAIVDDAPSSLLIAFRDVSI